MGDFGASGLGDWKFTLSMILFFVWPIVLAACGLLWGTVGAGAWVLTSIFVAVVLRR